MKSPNKKFEIYFIMGADNLINFHKWYKWKSIIKKCNLLVFDRQGYKAKSLKSVTFNGVNKNNIRQVFLIRPQEVVEHFRNRLLRF